MLSTAAPRYGHLVKRLHHVAYNEGARTDRTSRLVGTLGGDVRFEPRPEQNSNRDFRNHQAPRGLVVSFLHFSLRPSFLEPKAAKRAVGIRLAWRVGLCLSSSTTEVMTRFGSVWQELFR